MSDPGGRRRFDDQEVSLILRRASELQETQTAGTTGGMTLSDLEAVAREAGLDPALIRQAAAELPTRGSTVGPAVNGGGPFLGAPTLIRYERVVEGEVSPADYDVLVEEIRRTMNDVGVLSTLGRTFAWGSTQRMRQGGGTGRAVNVTVASRGGRTAIRVEESLSGLAGGLFGGIMGGVGGGGTSVAIGIGFAALHSGLAATGIWLAFVGGAYTLARTIFTKMVRRRADQLSSLADRLADLVASSVPND